MLDWREFFDDVAKPFLGFCLFLFLAGAACVAMSQCSIKDNQEKRREFRAECQKRGGEYLVSLNVDQNPYKDFCKLPS